MPRRRVIEKRAINPDSVYGNELLSKFINHLMKGGKKSVAESIVYGALELIEKKTKRDPLSVFLKAIEHVEPLVEVKSRRVGGATYQVPIEVNESRAKALAMRWIVLYSRQRGEKGMVNRLAGELIDAADEEGGGKGKGGAVKKREDTHRMADANKAFSHYRF
jgi:small subunit ribosomal protein S7